MTRCTSQGTCRLRSTPPPANAIYWIAGAGQPSLIEPYVKNTQIGFCPSRGQSRYGYAYNVSLIGGNISLGQVKRPAETLMFVDDSWNGRTAYLPSQGVANWGANFAEPAGAAANWGVNCPVGIHNDGVNIAFCDGHAKWMKPLALWNNGSDAAYYSLN